MQIIRFQMILEISWKPLGVQVNVGFRSWAS